MTDRLLLYDGVCALCNRVVQFVLRFDKRRRFCFSALQSDFARETLERHGRDPDDLDTFVLVLDHGTPQERLLVKGRGGLRVLREMGGLMSLAAVLEILPTPLLDWGYDRIAGSRYEKFGKYDTCPLPPEEHRGRFLG